MTVKAIILLAVLVIAMGLVSYLLGFKEWLRWAVIQAESKYGSGTGMVKLREVYDMAVLRFPIIAKLMPFSVFSWLVDLALKWMKEQMFKNENIADLINNQATAVINNVTIVEKPVENLTEESEE